MMADSWSNRLIAPEFSKAQTYEQVQQKIFWVDNIRFRFCDRASWYKQNMFQATRRRLAFWYAAVTAVLLLLFASGFYWYVRTTLVERIDDTLSHVVEVVQRSLVIEPDQNQPVDAAAYPLMHVNVEASFRNNADATEDDHIDLEWFSPTGDLLWTTFSTPIDVPIHVNPKGETVHTAPDHLMRQVTQRLQLGRQVLGYLRVSHPWFEVTKPTRRLLLDLGVGIVLIVATVGGLGWFLSGLAIAPVRESYQQLKQFTADASHELRNPIAVIQTNVQVALADPKPDVDFQRYQLKVIERLTRRLGYLVDDLLFLARQDSGMSPPQFQPVEMDALLVQVLEEQQAIALDQSITLSLQLDEVSASESAAPRSSLPIATNSGYAAHPVVELDAALTIGGDRDQLIRLFTNLVSNAIQYTPAGGEVELSARWLTTQQPTLQVQVRDTGIGIPAESLPLLFDRFYRVDPARTHGQPSQTTHSGSGLGLAIAQVIVSNHHGSIRIDSVVHQGTTVTVLLPQSQDATRNGLAK